MPPAPQSATPYLDALRAYAARDPGRFHVPGHKGGPGADPALREALGPGALALDIPALTYGIDVGEEPTPFQQAQDLAAEAWGARRTWFMVNGASQGNHVALLALAHRGRSVVVQRNAHSSTIDALVVSGLRPDVRGAGARPQAVRGPLHDAGGARPGPPGDPGRRGRDGRVSHLLRRDGRRGRAARGGALPRRAAGGGRVLGSAPRLPRGPAAPRARPGRRPGDLEHPQDRGQPHPVGHDPPRPRRSDGRGRGGPLHHPDRVHQPELAPQRVAGRGPAPRRRARTRAPLGDAPGAGPRPRRGARDPRARRARRAAGRGPGRVRLRPAAAGDRRPRHGAQRLRAGPDRARARRRESGAGGRERDGGGVRHRRGRHGGRRPSHGGPAPRAWRP